VVQVPLIAPGCLDLRAVLALLGSRGVSSVLVEGGAEVLASFLRARLADRLVIIVAPKIVGKGKDAVGELGIVRMADAIPLTVRRTLRRGGDLILEAVLAAASPSSPPP